MQEPHSFYSIKIKIRWESDVAAIFMSSPIIACCRVNLSKSMRASSEPNGWHRKCGALGRHRLCHCTVSPHLWFNNSVQLTVDTLLPHNYRIKCTHGTRPADIGRSVATVTDRRTQICSNNVHAPRHADDRALQSTAIDTNGNGANPFGLWSRSDNRNTMERMKASFSLLSVCLLGWGIDIKESSAQVG